jgi:uncharacterized SAM-binding protein YcdF (DUF218 family)
MHPRFFHHAGGMFWLKKFFAPFLFPLQFALVAGVVGLVLSWSQRWRRTGQALLTLAVLVLLLASNRWVSGRLISPLEARFPAIGEFQPGDALPAPLAGCQYVVVLGGGHQDTDDRPSLTRLSSSARARLAEAVRLLRLLPAAKLIVSGPDDMDHGGVAHAQVLADAAVSLGVDRVQIRMIDDAHDTEEETARLHEVLGNTPFALITSAWHLPRAAALSAAQGLHALPCPTDYLYCKPLRWRRADFTWDVESLERSTAAVHEYLGLLWSRLRGKT